MGKKYTTFLTLFTVICITLTGCERENEQTANQGRLNLKLAVDTTMVFTTDYYSIFYR